MKRLPSDKVLKQKQEYVAGLTDQLNSSVVGVLVDYKGINVEQDTIMRKALREAGVSYFVAKNTMIRRAAENVGITGLDEVLNGTTALALSENDYSAASKIFKEYQKNIESFSIKGGFIEGQAATKNDIESLAELPSKEVLIAKVLGGFNAPIAGLANVLNANLSGLARVLNQIAEQKSA